MKFDSPEMEEYLRNSLGAPIEAPILEVYLKAKGEYVHRTVGWKRSQQQKRNWRKHRFSYERGIKRASRRGVSKEKKSSLLGDLRAMLRAVTQGEERVEVVPMEYRLFEVVSVLSEMEADVAEGMTHFSLEESYIEGKIFSEDFFGSTGRLKEAFLLGGTVLLSDLEMVLSVLGEESVVEFLGIPVLAEEALIERLMK